MNDVQKPTPEMIAAGVKAFKDWWNKTSSDWDDDPMLGAEKLASDIFIEMQRADSSWIKNHHR